MVAVATRDETPCAPLTPNRGGLAEALACMTNVAVDEWRRFVAFGAPRIEIKPQPTQLDALTLWPSRGPGRGSTLTVETAAEAWEVLTTRGPIPAAWLFDPRRAFAHDGIDVPCAVCGGSGEVIRAYSADEGMDCEECEGRGVIGVHRDPIAHPPTIATCIAMASDVAGVAQAEAFAREAVARLARYGAPQPDRIVWRVGAWNPRGSAWGVRLGVDTIEPWRTALCRHSGSDAFARAWQLHSLGLVPASETDLAPGTVAWLRAHRDVFADDAPNPWQPVCDVFGVGYALDTITDDAITLVCPAL